VALRLCEGGIEREALPLPRLAQQADGKAAGERGLRNHSGRSVSRVVVHDDDLGGARVRRIHRHQ
jgi:hypothetical protein